MMVVGVLTLAVSARGSMQLGGLTSAMVGLGVACFGPLIGAAADRYGQRPTLLVLAAANSAALGLLAWVAYGGLPEWTLLLFAFLVGTTAPQTSPMSRTRLLGAIRSTVRTEDQPKTLSTALAFESAADEVVFVFGPVVVGLLATVFGGWAPVTGAAILSLVFVSAFALHRTSAPAVSASERLATLAPVRDLWRPELLLVVLGATAVGLFFGSTLTALTSFLRDRGIAEQAGLLYGVMGIGSAILAIGVAWLPPRFSLRTRWFVFSGVTAAGTVLLQFVSDVPGMAWTLALTGIGIGPLLVTVFSLAAARTPEGRSATVMSMVGTGIMVGQSSATAVTGLTAGEVGTAAAMALPLASAVLAVGAALVNLVAFPGLRSQHN
ncbi:MFS transporter [Leucobacter weissii]|uniref:MFS transporter n=2 Tax=Leucobacter weissii TaxID=1983706 RepID=A0A939S4Y9_9MICO|nr:MFS transporter [Leucobacter weissii]